MLGGAGGGRSSPRRPAPKPIHVSPATSRRPIASSQLEDRGQTTGRRRFGRLRGLGRRISFQTQRRAATAGASTWRRKKAQTDPRTGEWALGQPNKKEKEKKLVSGGDASRCCTWTTRARALGTAARRPTLLQRSFSGGSARQSLSYSWHTRALSQHFLAVGRLTRRGPPTLSAIDWWGTDCVRVCCGGQADGGGLQQAAQVRRQTGHISGP